MDEKSKDYILQHRDGKSVKKIASELGVPERTVRKFLERHRARPLPRGEDATPANAPRRPARTLPAAVIAGLALTALTLFFFNDVIFGGRTLKASVTIAQAVHTGPYGQQDNRLSCIPYIANDPAVLEEPYLEFKRHAFSKGIFPLWNPHQACGMPFFANGQPAVLFPLSVFLYLIPEKYSWDFYIILQIFLAGLFTYFLMRVLKYPLIPSIVAAAAYMFSGPVVTWMVNMTTNTTAMLPLLFICVEKIMREHDGKWLFISSLVVGVLITSGHPEHVFFAFLTASVYFLLRMCYFRKEDNIGRWRVIQIVCVALCLGMLLASIFIIPLIEYISQGWTSHHPRVGLTSEEDPAKAITILIPYFFQKVLMTLKYERAGWYGGYIGVAVVLLGLIGMARKDRDRNNVVFGAVALFVIAKCYGMWPVNGIGYLPIFNKLRYSLHYTQDFAFAMAILAGIGVHRLTESEKPWNDLLRSSLAIASVIAGYLIYYRMAPGKVGASAYAFLLLALFVTAGSMISSKKALSIVLGLLLAFELYGLMPKEHARKYSSFPKVPYIEFLKEQQPRMRSFGMLWSLFPNTATAYGIDDVGVYEGLLVKSFVEYVRGLIDPSRFPEGGAFVPELRVWLPDPASPFLDLLNVGYFVTPPSRDLKGIQVTDLGELVYSGEVFIYRRPGAFPRSFIAHRAVFKKDAKEALEFMKAHAGDLRNIVVLDGEDDPAMRTILEATPPVDTSDVKIVAYGTNEVRLEASLSHPGILVLADAFYPGWRAYVDGKEERVMRADTMVRAVFVREGRHTIEFSYRPRSFIVGLWLSGVALLVIVFGLLISVRPARNEIAPQTHRKSLNNQKASC